MSTAEHVPAAGRTVPPDPARPVPALLRGLVDDAALFPPGNAPMSTAVAEHRHHVNARYADFVGPLLCPVSRIDELADRLAAGRLAGGTVPDGRTAGGASHLGRSADGALDIGLIADTGPDELLRTVRRVRADDRLVLRQVECRAVPAPGAGDDPVAAVEHTLAALDELGDLPRYLEVPRGPGWLDAVRRLDAAGGPSVGAKLRTGGLTADAFPSITELAGFVALCAEADRAFKLTAGLHRAVRHTVEGTDYHGYLNVLAAVCLRRTGAGPDAGPGGITGALAARSVDPLVDVVRPVLSTPDVATAVRAWFHSYGSCSIAEPLVDLANLGLLPAYLVEDLPAAREAHA